MEKKKQVLGIVEWSLVFVLTVSLAFLAIHAKNRLQEGKEMISMENSKLVLYEGD